MVLQLRLRKVGNSVGLVLPKEALAYLKVAAGDMNEHGFADWLEANSRRAGR